MILTYILLILNYLVRGKNIGVGFSFKKVIVNVVHDVFHNIIIFINFFYTMTLRSLLNYLIILKGKNIGAGLAKVIISFIFKQSLLYYFVIVIKSSIVYNMNSMFKYHFNYLLTYKGKKIGADLAYVSQFLVFGIVNILFYPFFINYFLLFFILILFVFTYLNMKKIYIQLLLITLLLIFNIFFIYFKSIIINLFTVAFGVLVRAEPLVCILLQESLEVLASVLLKLHLTKTFYLIINT